MRRGFSLPEMLLAVFILGIGIISITALFPVGLTQQQRSQKDVMGPLIAKNAIDALRLKLSADMFGYRNLQGFPNDPVATLPGDFSWSVPAFRFTDDPSTPDRDERGIADIFGSIVQGCDTSTGIPVNPYKPNSGAVITQEERMSEDGRYGWDFAIRRQDGRIEVAVFVYRVVNDTWADYWTVRSSPAVKVLGINEWPAGTVDIPMTAQTDPWESWQAPGAVVLDEYGDVHAILNGRRTSSEGPASLKSRIENNTVTRLWYISSIQDSRGFEIEPVYIVVFDL